MFPASSFIHGMFEYGIHIKRLLPNRNDMVEIREASLRDVEAIVELNKKLADIHAEIDEIYKRGCETSKGFRNHVESLISSENASLLVAEMDGRVAGYMIGLIEKPRPFLKLEKIGRISDAYVDFEYRKKGVGRALLNRLLEWFRSNGVEYITLSVDVRNRAGYSFWRKMGFEDWMVRMIRRV